MFFLSCPCSWQAASCARIISRFKFFISSLMYSSCRDSHEYRGISIRCAYCMMSFEFGEAGEKNTFQRYICPMISLLHLRIWIIYTQYSQVIPKMGTPNALVSNGGPATAWMSKNSIWPWASISPSKINKLDKHMLSVCFNPSYEKK